MSPGLAKPEMNYMNATAIRDENVFDATMTAVIIYDKCESAAKAKQMLERVSHRTDERRDQVSTPAFLDSELRLHANEI